MKIIQTSRVTLAWFREALPEIKNEVIAQLIVAQNPRLHRGDDMDARMQTFTAGRKGGSHTKMPVSALCKELTIEQVSSGHPYVLRTDAEGDYLHMYDVIVRSPFDDHALGSELRTSFQSPLQERSVQIPIIVTQELLDAHSKIYAQFGLSKHAS